MKKIVFLILCLFFINSSYGANPYFGFEYKNLKMSFEHGYGDTNLPKFSKYVGGYYGVRFENDFLIESGIESTLSNSRVVYLNSGQLVAGTPIPGMLEPAVFRNRIRIFGPYVSLIKAHPILYFSGKSIEFLGGVGVSFLEASATRETLSLAGVNINRIRRMSDRKAVFRAMSGIQYLLFDNFKIRASIGWLNTSVLDLEPIDNVFSLYPPRILFKDTYFYGIGATLEF